MKRLALIIDDNRQTANSMARMLQLLGYETKTEFSPRNALISVTETKPAVLFLDINMPGVDGFEVLGFIKRDPDLHHIPVVIISTETQSAMVERARSYGAAGYLMKPIGVDSLEKILEGIFKT